MLALQGLHFAPVETSKQGLELRTVQRHYAAPNRRLGEGDFLQPLVGHQQPLPSQNRIFSLSARFAWNKKNMVPVNGSYFRTDCTSAARSSWPFLMSTGCVATRMRTVWDGIFTRTPRAHARSRQSAPSECRRRVRSPRPRRSVAACHLGPVTAEVPVHTTQLARRLPVRPPSRQRGGPASSALPGIAM